MMFNVIIHYIEDRHYSKLSDSCTTLRQRGVTLQGFYYLNITSTVEQSATLVECFKPGNCVY